MKTCFTTLLILSAAVTAQAQPVIKAGGVVNSASYAASALPNGAIAQGSLFVVFGSGLGPAALQQITAYPLSTSLGGTSLTVTVGGSTTQPLIVYTSASQLAAILPSNTPTGNGTITVTYNGQTSASVPIQVATSSFGIYSVNQAGSGTGIITNTNYQVTNLTSASNPGEAYILWGTGLGPVTGNEAAGGSAVKIGTIPVEVLVGGKSASVLGYARAGCCAGLDQVAFSVPSGVTGCSVPVAVKIGNVVSNYVTLPIAASGRTCSDPSNTSPVIITGNGNVSIGGVDLSRSNISFSLPGVGSYSGTSDIGSGSFTRYRYSDYSNIQNPFKLSTYGSCTVFTFQGGTATVPDVPSPVVLDAGPSLTVNGPNGLKTLTKTSGSYSAQLGGGIAVPGLPAPAPLYLSKGTYTVTGPGGADVGPFTATLTIPDPQNWTNSAAITTVNRSNGQLITWTGGDPSGNTYIYGASTVGTTTDSAAGAEFVCVEKTSAGQFTIPSLVLLSLPATTTNPNQIVGGILGLLSNISATFKATGLDQGTVSSSTIASQTVTYQ